MTSTVADSNESAYYDYCIYDWIYVYILRKRSSKSYANQLLHLGEKIFNW